MPRARKPKPPGRKRRLIGWALLTLAFLTVAAWTASAWWAVELGTDRRGLRLWNGTLSHWSLHPLFEADASWRVLAVVEGPNSTTYNATRSVLINPERTLDVAVTPLDQTWRHHWWFGIGRNDTLKYALHNFGVYQRTTIPDGTGAEKTVSQSLALWPLTLLLAAAGIAFFRSAHTARFRAALNLCPTCGYNLEGLDPTAKCPECGRVK